MPLAPIMPASTINVRVTNRCPLARQTREQLARLSIAKHLHSRLCPLEPVYPCPFRKSHPAWESHRRVESSRDRERCLRSCIRSECSASTCSSRGDGSKSEPVSSSSTQYRLKACATSSSTARE